jgi:hypothetical protein
MHARAVIAWNKEEPENVLKRGQTFPALENSLWFHANLLACLPERNALSASVLTMHPFGCKMKVLHLSTFIEVIPGGSVR